MFTLISKISNVIIVVLIATFLFFGFKNSPSIYTAHENNSPTPPTSTPQNIGSTTSGIKGLISNLSGKNSTTEKLKTALLPGANSVKSIVSAKTISATSLNELNEKTRTTIVNILCATNINGPLKPITASGVIIDKRGVILTNAHVGQYFLLDNLVNCSIRTGSPATLRYKAKLIYISPNWVEHNHSNIIEENPLGTGEDDFAFLLITSPIGDNPLPGEFPALSVATTDKELDPSGLVWHIIAAYPAGFLGGTAIQRDLFLYSSVAQITELFTFKEKTVDVIALGGNILAQRGASGGAVVNSTNDKLVGIIVTTTNGETTSERDLRAVTTSHINRSLSSSAGFGIVDFLNADIEIRANLFNKDIAPYLKGILLEEIKR